MAETPEQKENRENYEASVDTLASAAKWDVKLLGLYKKSCEEPPTPKEMNDFIKNFTDKVVNPAATQSKNTGQFYSDVESAKRENAISNEETHKVNTYKQAHVEAKMELFGWLENNPKHKGAIRYKKFIQNMEEIIKAREDLKILDGQILVYQNMLEKAETGRYDSLTPAVIKRTLLQIQDLTRQRIAKITPIHNIEQQNNQAWSEILQELENERKNIQNKFGVKLENLLREKQVHLDKLSTYNADNPKHELERMKLREKIDACEISIAEIKRKIMAYKSSKPIFLFEDLMGAKSMPSIQY